MKLKKILYPLFLIAACFHVGCDEENILPSIPLNPPVLANPVSMAADPVLKRLYVANSNGRVRWEDTSFLVFDISDPTAPQVIRSILIPNFAGQMILDPARKVAYLPCREGESEVDENESILKINLDEASANFLKYDRIPSGENPFGIFMLDDELWAAASHSALRYNLNDLTGFSEVNFEELSTNEDRLLSNEQTRELALSPSGSHLFVTNRQDTMLILNVADFTAPTGPGRNERSSEAVDYVVTGTLSTRGIARDANFLYVVDGVAPALRILSDANLAPVQGPPLEISTATLQVASIPLGEDPGEILLDEATGRAYISNEGGADVSIIDLNLQKEIGRIELSTQPEDVEDEDWDGDKPFGMALVSIGGVRYLYVAHYETNLISIINADTLTLIKKIGPGL